MGPRGGTVRIARANSSKYVVREYNRPRLRTLTAGGVARIEVDDLGAVHPLETSTYADDFLHSFSGLCGFGHQNDGEKTSITSMLRGNGSAGLSFGISQDEGRDKRAHICNH